MDQKEFETTLVQAEARLKRLRVLYDQWFMGIERVEPQQQRLDIERTLARLRAVQIRNTALRFRFTQFLQRYTTYNTYWKRVTRQIEEGTYKRDVLRAQRLRRAGADAQPRHGGQEAYEIDVDGEIDVDIGELLDSVAKSEPPPPAGRSSWPPPLPDRPSSIPREITPFAMPATGSAPDAPLRAFPVPRSPVPVALPPAQRARTAGAGRPVAPPPVPSPPPARRPRAAPASGNGVNGVSEDQIRRIFDRYVQARAKNAERTDNIKYETIAKSVRSALPKLEQKHAGKKIDFEVVVRNGKVALKPVPK